MNYKKLTQEERDIILKNELDSEIVKIIEKFNLKSSEDLYWISEKENTFTHKIFKHNYLKKNSLMSILFRVHGLCFAKVNYFKENLVHYEPYIYDIEKGFIKTELWNAEFLKHKTSGYYLDFRQLTQITKIEDFIELYENLESFQENDS